ATGNWLLTLHLPEQRRGCPVLARFARSVRQDTFVRVDLLLAVPGFLVSDAQVQQRLAEMRRAGERALEPWDGFGGAMRLHEQHAEAVRGVARARVLFERRAIGLFGAGGIVRV